MSKRITAVFLLLVLLAAGPAARGETGMQFGEESFKHLRTLMTLLRSAYETPKRRNESAEEAEIAAIAAISETEGLIARDIAENWRKIYLDKNYPVYLFKKGEETASALEASGAEFGSTHAFVVLGYALRNGEISKELKARCNAAAAAARSYPDTILVCTGGATGANNPDRRTEAGVMKEYLVNTCGIDPERILTEDQSLSTQANAVNTFRILEERGIRTVTIVTSHYHQRWGQAVFSAVFSQFRRTGGYEVDIVLNYCCKVAVPAAYEHDDRFAVSQILDLFH